MANSTKISEYSTTAANNTSIDSIDIDENCAASGINNAIRSVLKHQADAFTQGTPIALDQTNNRVGIGTTSPAKSLSINTSSNTDGIDIGGGGTVYTSITSAGTDTTIQATNAFAINTNGANERVRIDSSGNVGIGDASPSTKLHINNGGASGSGQADCLRLENPGTSVDDGPVLKFTAGNSTTGAGIGAKGKALNSAQLVFRAGGDTERMVIDTNGNTAIGTTHLGAKLNIGGSMRVNTTQAIGPGIIEAQSTASGTGAIGVLNSAGTSGFFALIQFANAANTAIIGSIKKVNDASVQYNTTSDARLKENISDMTGAITRVKQLAPKRYSWVNEDLDAADQDGFLAHEAQTVVPMAVSGTQDEVDDDGNPVYMQMDYSKLVPLLTGALKEAITKIETLETEMTALKARVTALEA